MANPIIKRGGFWGGFGAGREIPAVICDDDVRGGLRDKSVDFAANECAVKQIDKKLGEKILAPWIYV